MWVGVVLCDPVVAPQAVTSVVVGEYGTFSAQASGGSIAGGIVNVTLNFLTSTNAEGQAALARIVSGGTLPTHTPVRRRPEPAAAIVVASPSVDQPRALPVENTDQRVCVCVCVCCMWSMCSCNVCVWHGQCSLPFPSQGYGLHSACL